MHRRGGHVEAHEEECARRPPLVEQVRRVGRVDVDALGALAVVGEARAEAGAEQQVGVGRRHADGDEAQATVAHAAAVARVVPALGERARVCDDVVVQHLAPRRVLREGAVQVMKDRLRVPAPAHPPARLQPRHLLEARLHRARVDEVVARAVRRDGLREACDGRHVLAVIVDEGGHDHGQAVPRRRLEAHTPRHRSGGLVVGVDDRAAVQVVGRQLLEAVVEDLAAVPTVDAIVVDDRLAERLEGVLHLDGGVTRGAG
mmetsp:Transcript_60220/g.144731  ORF Transcript_60220/g.144731 Transcript_60220/m.144731 type:complete len:259 (+) Transcript_60220:448-1224(+)